MLKYCKISATIVCQRQSLPENHVHNIADHPVVLKWKFRGLADRSQQTLFSRITGATRQREKSRKHREKSGDMGNGRGSYGLVVACLLCALRFSKYRIEDSCAYVIRTYIALVYAREFTHTRIGRVTQFPDVPNARKMEPGAHLPRTSTDFPSVPSVATLQRVSMKLFPNAFHDQC